MSNLIEFKVTKTLFDEVKNDLDFRFGFEAEFHVRNAHLLLDEDEFDPETEGSYQNQLILLRIGELLETHMGLPQGSITILHTGYQQWMLKQEDLGGDDFGVELVSPVMPLQEGLSWMAKVCEMIGQFNQGGLTLYTSEDTGLHANLSHVNIRNNFDFAKLAILSGDEHYLGDFQRLGNRYTHPLLRAVYDTLVLAKENPTTTQPNALRLLSLRGWSPERVMQDLAALIPMSHYMSVDLSRLRDPNPYIEVRIPGNQGYEQRFDEVAQLVIRFGALIKIACDPNAYREEYLKKIYQLVAGVTPSPAPPQQTQDNQFPRLRVYLAPIMTTATRSALDKMEAYTRRQSLSVPDAARLFIGIVRSAMETHQTQSPRVRHGLSGLLKAIRVTPADLIKAVRRMPDIPVPLAGYIGNFVKGLDQPAGRQPIMNSRALRDHERMVAEQGHKQKRTKRRDQEQEYRLKMKAKQLEWDLKRKS